MRGHGNAFGLKKRSAAEVSFGIRTQGISPQHRTPARAPPPTFLFLPVHLSKSPADAFYVRRRRRHRSRVRCRISRRSQLCCQAAKRREAFARSEISQSIGLKTEGNLNPSMTGSPSGVRLYRRRPAALSTLRPQKRTENETFQPRGRGHIGAPLGLHERGVRFVAPQGLSRGCPIFLPVRGVVSAGRSF